MREERREKVEDTPETNYWLHPIVVVPKKGTDKVQLYVDVRRLNEYCIRPSNSEGTPWEKIRNLLTGKRWYTAFDTYKGYHQVPLDEPTRKYTTFFTPHGKCCYLSLPMGYSGSKDIFDSDRLWTPSLKPEPRKTASSLPTVKTNPSGRLNVSLSLSLNMKETHSGKSVIFASYLIDKDGAKLDPALYKAITDFPVPKTLTELGPFLGLAQQQAHFTSAISELTAPLHPLLKKSNNLIWTQEMKPGLSQDQAVPLYTSRPRLLGPST